MVLSILLSRGKMVHWKQKETIDPTKDTVQEYAFKWLYTFKIMTVKRSTFDLHEKMFLRYIFPAIGSKKIKDVTDADLQKILNEAAETKAYSTVKKIRETMCQCWGFAYITIIQDIFIEFHLYLFF